MCDPGERATGGGAGFQGNGGNEIVQQTYPLRADGQPAGDGDTPVGWGALVKNANTGALPDTFGYAVCARPERPASPACFIRPSAARRIGTPDLACAAQSVGPMLRSRSGGATQTAQAHPRLLA